jgi:hypothetical protein
MTNADLEGYNPEAKIRISKALRLRDVISRLFPGTTTTTRQSGVESALRRELITY